MTKEELHERTNGLVRWASDLGRKHNVVTTTILVQFRRLRNAGAEIEEAKRGIEEIYES